MQKYLIMKTYYMILIAGREFNIIPMYKKNQNSENKKNKTFKNLPRNVEVTPVSYCCPSSLIHAIS